MSTLISGTLIDGAGQPVRSGQIFLTALTTSSTVIRSVEATITPDAIGRYSMQVEPGKYSVTLFLGRRGLQTVGTIEVRVGAASGTLNDFLMAPTSGALTDDVMARFEALAKQVDEAADEAVSVRDETVQIQRGVNEQAAKAKDAATDAESAAVNARRSETAAAQALKDAQAIAKTPMPGEIGSYMLAYLPNIYMDSHYFDTGRVEGTHLRQITGYYSGAVYLNPELNSGYAGVWQASGREFKKVGMGEVRLFVRVY